jgi:hypothetical protein
MGRATMRVEWEWFATLFVMLYGKLVQVAA